MNILISGGAGFIGAVTVSSYLAQGHSVVVIDNLSRGWSARVDPRALFYRENIGNLNVVAQIMRRHEIDTVVHLAAHTNVEESMQDPSKYYENNFGNTVNVLKAMVIAGVPNILFSSSCAVYGDTKTELVNEFAETHPMSSYGRSKLMAEQAIIDFVRTYQMGATILRYFNVAGQGNAGDQGHLMYETHILPRVFLVAKKIFPHIHIYGQDYSTSDGSCVRDYVHVQDIARAHLLASAQLKIKECPIYNLGLGQGSSVLELLEACRAVTGHPVPALTCGRRLGDPGWVVAENGKARSRLHWVPHFTNLDAIIRDTWSKNAQSVTSNRLEHSAV